MTISWVQKDYCQSIESGCYIKKKPSEVKAENWAFSWGRWILYKLNMKAISKTWEIRLCKRSVMVQKYRIAQVWMDLKKLSGSDFCQRRSLEEMTFPLQRSQDAYLGYMTEQICCYMARARMKHVLLAEIGKDLKKSSWLPQCDFFMHDCMRRLRRERTWVDWQHMYSITRVSPLAPSWPPLSLDFFATSNTVKNLTNEKKDNSASAFAHSLKVSYERDKIAAMIQSWYRAEKLCPCHSLERSQLLEIATGRDVRFWKIKPMKAYKLRP